MATSEGRMHRQSLFVLLPVELVALDLLVRDRQLAKIVMIADILPDDAIRFPEYPRADRTPVVAATHGAQIQSSVTFGQVRFAPQKEPFPALYLRRNRGLIHRRVYSFVNLKMF